MSGHTPGPWRFYLDPDDWDPAQYPWSQWRIGAPGNGELMSNTRYYPSCPDSIEDWRLIAAAPDLLAALDRLLSATMYKDHPEASQAAIDAIAKATQP